MSEQLNPPHCPKAETCLDAGQKHLNTCLNARESLRYVETTPLIPAERLCIEGLKGHRESRSSSPIVDDFANICFDIDRAIAIPNFSLDEHDDYERDNRLSKRNIFETVVRTLGKTPSLNQAANGPNFPIAAQMKRIGIFLPAFRARINEQSVSPGLIKQIHAGLCMHIEALDDLMHQPGRNHALKKQIGAHKAECEVMALHSRIGEVPFPALSREEASHARKQHNHDFYTLKGNRKRPYQVKTSASSSGYSGEIVVIKHFDILRSLRRDPETHSVEWKPKRGEVDFEWPNPFLYEHAISGDAPNPLSELLIDEHRLGGKLPRDKKNALNLASQFVKSQ